jgi:hypothetical protein
MTSAQTGSHGTAGGTGTAGIGRPRGVRKCSVPSASSDVEHLAVSCVVHHRAGRVARQAP